MIYLLYAAAGVLLYAGGLTAPYFADDFTVFFPPGSINPFLFFVEKNPYEPTVYRPLENFFNCAVQSIWAENTLPVHLAHVALHILIACLICKALVRLDQGKAAAGIGGALFLAAQSAVSIVSRNCTMSQQLSALFCLLFLYVLVFSENRRKKPWLCILFVLALISKETSVSLLVSAVLLHLLFAPKDGRIVAVAKECAPYALLTAVYLLGRSALGLEVIGSSGRQTFRVGLGVVQNVGLLLFSNMNQVSIPEVYKAFVLRNDLFVAGAVACSVLLLAAAYAGLRKNGKPGSVIVLTALMGIGFFPAALMEHVSEVYAYNTLPYLCMIVGIGLGSLLRRGKAKRLIGAVAITALFTVNVFSLEHGLSLINHNAAAARNLIGQICDVASGCPPGASIHLIDTDQEISGYSYGLYYMSKAETLRYGWKKSFLFFLGRDDIHFAYWPGGDAAYLEKNERDLLITVQNGNIVPYEESV